MKHENILIPDEFALDYSLSEEEQEKQWAEYREKGKKAFQKLQEDT